MSLTSDNFLKNNLESPSKKLHSQKKERLDWIDYSKGIGIFLVVFGHALRGLISSSIIQPSPIVTFIDQWMYGFHMPLFFFISGLFIEGSLSKPFGKFIGNKLSTIVYPYFLWSIFQSLIQVVASRYTNEGLSLGDIWKIIYIPVMQFWFLYTLFMIMVIYGVLYKFKFSTKLLFILAVGLYGLHILDINFGAWGILYLTRRHAIYLALGAIIGDKNILGKLKQIKTSILGLGVLTGYLAVAIAVLLQLSTNRIAEPLIGIAGISSTVALAILIERYKVGKIFQFWGILSLEIYVAHTIFQSAFRIFLQKIFGVTEPFIHILLGTVIGLYAPIVLDSLAKKLKFPYMFTFFPRHK
jgi:fucose 4-O-acetylase-like acetyltransferase